MYLADTSSYDATFSEWVLTSMGMESPKALPIVIPAHTEMIMGDGMFLVKKFIMFSFSP
jgi:hypothetical protein